MKCPSCLSNNTKVVDSRDLDEENVTRRRRECLKCKNRYTTYERIEPLNVLVIKKDGSREFYDRTKLERGILKACEKREVSKEQIDKVINRIEEKLKRNGKEVKSGRIGDLVSTSLKRLDKVAYIRFASVYKSFDDLKEFERELRALKRKR